MQNKYRSKFLADEAEYIKSKWRVWIISNTWLAREIQEKFKWLQCRSIDGLRKAITSICWEFEAEQHRGEAINSYSAETNTLPSTVKHARHKTKMDDGSSISTFIKNPQYIEEETQELQNLRESVLEDIAQQSPIKHLSNYRKITDGHLLIISATDIHIGKLCDEYDTGNTYNESVAYKYAIDCIHGLLKKSNWFDIDKIVFIWWHDILHTDNPSRTTTKGTNQDTSGMWHSNARLWVKLYVEILEILSQVAPVEFVFCPSNHDYTHWWFMCQIVEAWFKGNENVRFHCDMKHRKYIKYGNSLIWFSHWDGCKEDKLGWLMSIEAKKDRAKCTFRYFYLWHLHHRIAKEYVNVTIEYTRSISGTDTRHNDKGYKSSQAMEAFIHSKKTWQIARFTHYVGY